MAGRPFRRTADDRGLRTCPLVARAARSLARSPASGRRTEPAAWAAEAATARGRDVSRRAQRAAHRRPPAAADLGGNRGRAAAAGQRHARRRRRCSASTSTAGSPASPAVVDATAFGYPLRSLAALPKGTYLVQALVNRYETFTRGDGVTVKLPPDKGEGQQWARKPGNLYSTPQRVTLDPAATAGDPPRARPGNPARRRLREAGNEVRQVRPDPQRAALEVLGPRHVPGRVGAAAVGLRRPSRRALSAGDQPRALPVERRRAGGRRRPIPTSKPDFSERFQLAGYNRIQQELAHQFYKDWTGPGFPRVLLVEIQHPTPFYDDSYAVNSANNGPYGDAIMYELVPEIERRFRGIGQGWARFTYGGSTGGWEAMAVQMFYPDDVQRRVGRLPRSRSTSAHYTVVNIYEDENAYYTRGAVQARAAAGAAQLPRPRHHHARADEPPRAGARHEDALGRSVGRLGVGLLAASAPTAIPKPIWNKLTGQIDKDVAAYWREHYDLSHILQRDWTDARAQAARQAAHLRRRHGQLLPQQRGVPGREVPEDRRLRRPTPSSTTAIAPSTAGTAITRARTRTRGCAIRRWCCRGRWSGC